MVKVVLFGVINKSAGEAYNPPFGRWGPYLFLKNYRSVLYDEHLEVNLIMITIINLKGYINW